jgi:hypothetical protein
MIGQLTKDKANRIEIGKHFVHFLLAACAVCIVLGCRRQSNAPQANDTQTIAEGVIYYVTYEMEDGRAGGFTRINSNKAVPGGNGSWNIDAYGRLTRDYLIIARPQKKDLGYRVIPSHRLLDIQFGDGGIKNVEESKPAPAE